MHSSWAIAFWKKSKSLRYEAPIAVMKDRQTNKSTNHQGEILFGMIDMLNIP
jgi:hypothetical protein